MRLRRMLPLCLSLLLLLSACGSKTADVTPTPPDIPTLPARTQAPEPSPSPTATPTETPEPEYTGPRNPSPASPWRRSG